MAFVLYAPPLINKQDERGVIGEATFLALYILKTTN
jgi:hypothetical protein